RKRSGCGTGRPSARPWSSTAAINQSRSRTHVGPILWPQALDGAHPLTFATIIDQEHESPDKPDSFVRQWPAQMVAHLDQGRRRVVATATDLLLHAAAAPAPRSPHATPRDGLGHRISMPARSVPSAP